MREELDKKLVEKFPKLFRDRYAPMTETCMCWGFCCGDGWFNILDALCSNIDHYVKWKREQRARALVYNRKLKRAISAQNVSYMLSANANTWQIQEAEEALALGKYRDVPEKVHHVTVVQVKEKFGTLRFYYGGGDSYVSGLVAMAESMSAVTCEECGVPGETGGDGWIATLCDSCRTKRKEV